jgi:flagellin
MGLRINTNISSVQALRSLSDVTDDQNQAVQRLSSGKRINHAADDAAGLAISDKLQAEIRGTLQATRNAQDGISMIQVAEGGMQEISNILVRLRELSVQSSSDTLGERERQFTDLEFQALSLEVDRIAKSTQFNGRSLLDGSVDDALEFQIGNRNDDFNDRISFEPTKATATLEHLGVDGLTVTEKDDAQENLAKIDEAIETISSNRANLGSLQSRLESTVNNLETFQESSMAANSRIRDADIAVESANLARANILSAANTSILAQANSSPATALKLVA